MAIDEDIAASLPEPPPPAPARRDAAIGAAMARFDGVSPAAPVRERRRIGGPQIGVLVSAALVAFVGIPALWMSTRDPVAVTQRGAAESAAAESSADDALAVAENQAVETSPVAPQEALPSDAAVPVQADADVAAPQKEESRQETAPKLPPAVPPPPPAAAPAPLEERPGEPEIATTAQRRAEAFSGTDNIVVTGAKVSRPAAARARRAAGRGDWNACTINDPARNLVNCRRLADPQKPAGAHVADGLARAWRGDYGGAIADFDKAIAADPKSGIAYLNRGLAHREKGDEDRALADLDRAVRYAPSARAYYNRGQVRRERGDKRRAEADEDRAAELDPRYSDIIE